MTKLISKRESTPRATVSFDQKRINTQRNRPCFNQRHVANPWRIAWPNNVQTTARAYRDYCARYSPVRFARWIRRGISMTRASQSALLHSRNATLHSRTRASRGPPVCETKLALGTHPEVSFLRGRELAASHRVRTRSPCGGSQVRVRLAFAQRPSIEQSLWRPL